MYGFDAVNDYKYYGSPLEYTYILLHMYVCMYVYIYIYMYICIYLCMYVCIYIYIYIYTRIVHIHVVYCMLLTSTNLSCNPYRHPLPGHLRRPADGRHRVRAGRARVVRDFNHTVYIYIYIYIYMPSSNRIPRFSKVCLCCVQLFGDSSNRGMSKQYPLTAFSESPIGGRLQTPASSTSEPGRFYDGLQNSM